MMVIVLPTLASQPASQPARQSEVRTLFLRMCEKSICCWIVINALCRRRWRRRRRQSLSQMKRFGLKLN